MDDESSIIEIYREILKMKGHEMVDWAVNGDEAVRKFDAMKTKPALVLMDHRMPVKDGLSAMKVILTHEPMQRVIFVTADHSVADSALNEGAARCLLKPFRMPEFFAAIDSVLAEGAGWKNPGR